VTTRNTATGKVEELAETIHQQITTADTFEKSKQIRADVEATLNSLDPSLLSAKELPKRNN
jgi:tetrahydromethanopterin S-methyltransferase subunit B